MALKKQDGSGSNGLYTKHLLAELHKLEINLAVRPRRPEALTALDALSGLHRRRVQTGHNGPPSTAQIQNDHIAPAAERPGVVDAGVGGGRHDPGRSTPAQP